jgi:glutamate-ammonia-ligase adenylyltransferase
MYSPRTVPLGQIGKRSVERSKTIEPLEEPLAVQRIENLAGVAFAELASARAKGNPDSRQALINLERWLVSTSNVVSYAGKFQYFPDLFAQFLTVLGSSQPIADTLIQNPEFASLFLDRQEVERRYSVEELVVEGEKLLKSATSPSHALDRLRYLKQRHNLLICINDLCGNWRQETVWEALADLADALIRLTLKTTWETFSLTRDLPPEPPIAIVAFGKLGGRELNYSSDIDLAFILETEANERVNRDCTKFCSILIRALSDRMGRGALYRVDLRLRPYGSQGSIISSLAAVDGYYRLYAEAWEIQALIKSRSLLANGVSRAWNEIKEARLYSTSLSDSSLAEVLTTRLRIEATSGTHDIKRGPGGIRDVEFLCQILQLVWGSGHPEVRQRSTCEAIRSLAEEHLIESSIGSILIKGYTFLRKLEHRLQLLGDRQTHTLPDDPGLRQKLAVTMGFEGSNALIKALELHRKSIRSLYLSLLNQEGDFSEARNLLAERLEPDASSFLQWFDALPEPEGYYRSLRENEESIVRVKTILRAAPRLIPRFKSNLHLTEGLLSGEIEWDRADRERWKGLPLDAPEQKVADLYTQSTTIGETQWVLGSGLQLSSFLTSSGDGLLDYVCRRFDTRLHLIGLGSYGAEQSNVGSDFDLLLLCDSDQQVGERSAQDMINFLLRLRRFGLEPSVDLRLRPDGQKGLLVRSFEGFGAYEVHDMEMWERFALGSARCVYGSIEALELVNHAAYANALTSSRLAELATMKTRIETERLKPHHQTRDIKIGFGGLNDLEWIVHLYEMKYPHRAGAGLTSNLTARIRNLGLGSLLNTVEVDSLQSALRHLNDLRARIALLDFPRDLVPENPLKLDRIAFTFDLPCGNDFLRLHEPIVGWVRNFFLATLTRLAA